jgi:hypothetical protein
VTGCPEKDNAETQRALRFAEFAGSALRIGFRRGQRRAGQAPPRQEIEADLGDRVSCRLWWRLGRGARLL